MPDDPGDAKPGLPFGVRLGVMLLLFAAGVLECLVLLFRWPLFQSAHGWTWGFISKPFGLMTLLLPVMAAVLAAAAWAVLRWPRAVWRNLAILMAAGWMLQMGFGLLEGRGLHGIRDRIVYSGHAQFAVQSIMDDHPLRTIRHYDEFVRDNPDRYFLRTKPPGQYMFYWINGRLANFPQAERAPIQRLDNLRTWAAITWPLLCYAALIPLFFLSARVLPRELSWHPCLLYLCVPSVLLVTLHLDQVLYPLLCCGALALTVEAARRRSRLLALAVGLWLYAAWFISFSLLPVAALVLLLLAVYRDDGPDIGQSRPLDWRSRALLAAMIALGAGAVAAAMLAGLGYNPLTRYRDALEFHATWKDWRPGMSFALLAARVNLLEFAVWIGLALAGLWGAANVMAAAHIIQRRRRADALNALILGVTAVILILAVGSKTLAEVMRLWLYFVPMVCIGAAAALRWLAREHLHAAFAALLTLEFVTAALIKRFQDFW